MCDYKSGLLRFKHVSTIPLPVFAGIKSTKTVS